MESFKQIWRTLNVSMRTLVQITIQFCCVSKLITSNVQYYTQDNTNGIKIVGLLKRAKKTYIKYMQCWSVKDFHILASKNGEELFRSSLFHYHLFPSTTKRGIMARVGYFGWSHYTPLENLSPLLWGDILSWSCYTGECHHVSLDASFPVDPINALISFRH